MRSILSITLKISILAIVLTYLPVDLCAQITVTDIDGNVYNTVAIGNQLWMKENLKVARYRNGDSIPYVSDGTIWAGMTTGGQSDYNNYSSYNLIYGKLYNFYAVTDSRHICPVGWHVPTQSDFTALVNYLGGESVAGGKLKESGSAHWYDPNLNATNETGFTALPGGFRWYVNGVFAGMSQIGQYWTSTEYNETEAYNLQLFYDDGTAPLGNNDKKEGYSVRCICDFGAGVGREDENLKDIQLWPNPFSDVVYFSNNSNSPFEIRIFDVTGKCVIEIHLETGTSMVNLQNLPEGVYVIGYGSQNTSTNNLLIMKK